MPFKKGQIPPGGKPFVKGQSGNPEGRPRKLATLMGIKGYSKYEVTETINILLSLSLTELKEIYENPNSTVLEKTIAGALKKSLEKGSLYSIDSLLDRSYGKATENTNTSMEISAIKITYGDNA